MSSCFICVCFSVQKDSNLEQRIQFLSELHQVFVRLGQEERSASEKRIPAFEPYDFLEALRYRKLINIFFYHGFN